MKIIKKLALLTGVLTLMGLSLTACDDMEGYSDQEEMSTEISSENTSQQNTEDISVSSEISSTEDTGYVTETVETDWNGYTITTDEIGYEPSEEWLDEDGYYTTEIDVATYLIEYHTLPENFITKKEAKKLGWSGGSLKDYGDSLCIGGDYFGNYEGLLPKKKGRSYYECDIDTMGKNKRGAKRIIYSDDGQIYFTSDHYESFELIYGSDQ